MKYIRFLNVRDLTPNDQEYVVIQKPNKNLRSHIGSNLPMIVNSSFDTSGMFKTQNATSL